MSVHLDWQISGGGDEPPRIGRRWSPSGLSALLAALLLVLLGVGAWQAGRAIQRRNERRLQAAVQNILDGERQALLAGDGERFFTYLDDDPAWQAAQLRPENQAPLRAGLAVTAVEERGEAVWANVQWDGENGASLQRVAFFRRRDGNLFHAAGDDDFWGPRWQQAYDWGQLVYHQVDEPWAAPVAGRVSALVAELCAAGCPLVGRVPFTLTLAADFAPTAAPGQLRLPSPRLLALDADGAPADPFWQQLRRAVVAQLTPAVLRFAVPQEVVLRNERVIFEQLAAQFSAQRPDIDVEIVDLANWDGDIGAALRAVDGVALPPGEALVAAGLVYDLTDFVQTDPAFEQGDFYEQIWQGAWWRQRMWFVPHAAAMRLIYYDRAAYRQAGRREPSLRWTWEEMSADLDALAARLPAGEATWAFLDESRDVVFAYAFDWNNRCPRGGACTVALHPAGMAAAFDWYRSLVAQPGLMPDLTHLSPDERDFRATNLVAPGRVLVWVDEPVFYERNHLRRPVGVVPFPGSERFDGVTPLWVQGGFVSQHSPRPLATWEWLTFLSYQNVRRQLRYVPARPSVAAATRYWSTLPRPLGEAMRAAFPFARAVKIEEQGLFAWEQLAAVLAGEMTPEVATQARPHARWFGVGK